MAVKVSSDAAGNVITPTSNPEYGYIRVTETRNLIDERGFLRPPKLSALVLGLRGDLKNLGWTAGKELPGKIIIKESLMPFNKKEPENDYKVAGNTNVVCCVGDQPIYRKTFYVQNTNMEDVLIAHTNKEQIVAAYEESITLISQNNPEFSDNLDLDEL